MKRLALLLALAATAHAAPPESFWRALHLVETSGRHGAILGDNGRSLGPLQISRAYFTDSRVGGTYEQVSDLGFARRVVSAYLQRYAPKAWAAGDVVTLARIHNGGPAGARKAATVNYGAKVARLSGGAR
jgi:hypothetical protein